MKHEERTRLRAAEGEVLLEEAEGTMSFPGCLNGDRRWAPIALTRRKNDFKAIMGEPTPSKGEVMSVIGNLAHPKKHGREECSKECHIIIGKVQFGYR